MTERRDWSEKDLRKMIVDQRLFMWREDTIERIALSLKLGQGTTVTDVYFPQHPLPGLFL